MSAALLKFPGLIEAAVVQAHRRGRLPAGVRSLVAHRTACEQKTARATNARQKALHDLCMRMMVRIDRGEVTGLLIISACSTEPDEVATSGAFAADPERALRCLDLAGDALADSWAKAVQP
jgi:hypothetical protein